VDPIERVTALFAENAQLTENALALQAAPIALAARHVVDSLLGGGKVLSCGNGCSAADAQYFAVQMIHRFERERPALPAVSLSTDAAVLTAIAPVDGLDQIYAKQIGALGHPGDVLLAVSTDGDAGNMITALEAAKERQLQIIALTGHDGGGMAACLRPADVEIRAPSTATARILENHRLVIHCLCDLIDLQLMGG
jgi:phosphoheptose isomerase